MLLEKIAGATRRICIVALYLEQDEGGRAILNALYEAKRQRPELDIRVLVDWHRAQRGRIGAAASNTNADWYCRTAQENRRRCARLRRTCKYPKRSASFISKGSSLMIACCTAARA